MDNQTHLVRVACDLVIIEWVDSRRPDAAWKRVADHQEWTACKCVSVGFLIADDNEKKVLAPNMADIDDASNIQHAGEIVIPSACVLSIKRLIETSAVSSCPGTV